MAQDSIRLGYCPDAPEQPYWGEIERILAPAAARGGIPVWEPGELVWIGIEHGKVIAAATTRMLDADTAELINVGGESLKRWVADMEALLCRWARDAGAKRFITRGRKGWLRFKLGWKPCGKENGMILFEKAL